MLAGVRHPRGAPRPTATVLVAVLAVTLAACGSQLDPETVRDANGGIGTTQDAPGTIDGGVDDGTGTTTDGGTTTSGGTTPGGTTGSGGSTGSGGGGGSSSGGGTTGGDPAGGTKGASCDGFKNGPGITDDTITIGNASDVSGPVPGLFESSQDAVKAYVAFFNQSSDICGRKLKLNLYDSKTDAAADQQAYTKGCDEVFAMVGSMSAFDSGGAGTAQGCGLPDIRSAAVTNDRNECTTCFAAQSVRTGEWQNAVPDFVKKYYRSSMDNAAVLYINAGAAAENGPLQAKAMTKRGMQFDYVQGIDVSEFNYAPYVQELKDRGIEVVFWVGAYQQSVRLRQAMDQQGYEPKLYLRDPTDYNPDYVESGGDAVEGTVIFLNFVPFEESGRSKELQLYLSWLQQVRPGATPTFFGLFSWSAARLFVERSIALGGNLTRSALIDQFKKTDDWTANGLHSPQHVGPKHQGDCWRFVKLTGGKWVPVGGSKYTCNGYTTA